MKGFTFLAPKGLDEAVALLDRHGPEAQAIAGGQSLLLAMKERLATPSVLVSLNAVPGLKDWQYDDEGRLDIGAGTTYASLARSSVHVLHRETAAVAGNLGDRPVRTMGTIGGALCQAEARFDMPALAMGVDASTTWALVFALQFLVAVEIAAVLVGSRVGARKIWVVFVPLLTIGGLWVATQLALLLPNLL